MSIFIRSLNRNLTHDEIEGLLRDNESLKEGIRGVLASLEVLPTEIRWRGESISLWDKVWLPLRNLIGLESPCKHHWWVDPTNEVVEAGPYRLCVLCGKIAIPEEESCDH